MKQLNHIYKLLGVIIGCILLLGLSFCSPVFGSSPTGTVILTQQEFQKLNQNLDELASINENQLNTIMRLETTLQTASLSTNDLQKELIEAKNSLIEQRKQLEAAKMKLEQQEMMLKEQGESLARVEAYLNVQQKELQKAKARQQKSNAIIAVLGISTIALAAK